MVSPPAEHHPRHPVPASIPEGIEKLPSRRESRSIVRVSRIRRSGTPTLALAPSIFAAIYRLLG
jgi:hypothetical protein